MNAFTKRTWIRIVLSLLAVAALTLGLTSVVSEKPITYQVEEPLTPMLQGIHDTMAQNAENSEAEDYLEQDPYLVNIYEGFGFAKDYLAARGHSFTLEDVTKTARPHPKANCITCKTPDFTKMVNSEGVEVYARPFDDVMGHMTQAISCYTCHGDDKGNNGQIVITHSYVEKALGENASQIDPKVLNCGQCHIEYYFTPEDSETMMPYHDQEGMTPEAILAYYDEMGFKDWEQPGTGTPMLKAQHPEMETFLSSKHAQMGLNCASCHMAAETAEDGSTYHSHYLISPLKSDALMETCATCHGSADAARTLVTATQERVTSRETEVGNRLSGLKDELTAAVAEGKMSTEELDAVRKLHREAQWFFDFSYVENSEGAHNSSLSMRCLETADGKITEALALLNGEEVPAPEPEVTAEAAGMLTASEKGFGGDVTVHVALAEDGTVQSLTIETPGETPGFGQRASEEEFAQQFIGKAGPFAYGENGIEALTGATITSGAALEAINKAIAGNAAETETADVKPEETTEPAVETAETKSEEIKETQLEPTEEKKENAAAEQGRTVYGSYLAEKETNFSTIRVLVSTKNGEITNCRIFSEAKSEGSDFLTDEIRGNWAKAIVENQSAETDAITGATLQFSAGAVKEAMAEILAQIGQEATAEVAETKPEPTEEKKENVAAEQGRTVYGSYLAEKETNFSTIRVLVSTKNGEITSCRILSEAKSEGSDFLTDEIRSNWAKAIVESQSAETDAITGATLQFSAGAVKEAMAEILAQMGQTDAAEPEKAAETQPETVPAVEAETKMESEPAAAEEEPAEEAKTPALFGGYLAEKETNFSTIRMLVSTKNGEITNCRILSEAKSEGSDFLTDEIRGNWAKAIVENQSAETDAITGATLQFSAGAVKEAMADIFGKMAK